jgi:tRNA pseudouridine55 synthase
MLGGVRCGHAGTLDPFATGLLLVALGRTTRLLRFLSASDKTYEGLVRLGLATDTDDRTGEPIGTIQEVDLSTADLDAAIASLSGSFDQIPPDYSARKHKGVRHYRQARRGQAVMKKPVRVEVAWEHWRILDPDLLEIRLTVSAGTYIRALARDLGTRLGCGGHLQELRRVRSGPFEAGKALSFPSSPDRLRAALIPPVEIPLALPTLVLPDDAARRFRTGVAVAIDSGSDRSAEPPLAGWVRLIDTGGSLIGLGEAGPSEDGRGTASVQPRIVF